MKHASEEDCPCCHNYLSPSFDTDRALVVAYLAGVAASERNVAIGVALCRRHAKLAADAVGFVNANAGVMTVAVRIAKAQEK